MDREDRNQGAIRPLEPEVVLQWGKRLRCNRVKNSNLSPNTNGGIRRRITSGVGAEPSRPQSNGFARGSQTSSFRSPSIDRRKSVSPDKEDRYYTTRGSLVGGGGSCSAVEENRKSSMDGAGEEKGGVGAGSFIWPKLYISLSKKEKEEDFLAMKGCKLPQRPKKRPKLIQRSLLLVSPGAWLSDLCQERYEVREKKTSKKQRPRGLKAMGAVESDSE